MKHSDLMILHKIKYKHIIQIMISIGAISSYWVVNDDKKTEPLEFLCIICCLICLFSVFLFFARNWNKPLL